VKEKVRKTEPAPTPEQEDTRPIDDPARLADEARATVEKNAAELRKQRVPIATEPPTVYRP
jgi:hypothetical protein